MKGKFSGIKCMAVHCFVYSSTLAIHGTCDDGRLHLVAARVFSIATANMHFPYFPLSQEVKETNHLFFLLIFSSHSLYPLYPYYNY